MISRKNFLVKSSLGILGTAFFSFRNSEIVPIPEFLNYENLNAAQLVENEDFWLEVRNQFSISNELILLNNGSVSPQPKTVIEAFEKEIIFANLGPSYFLRVVQEQKRETLRTRISNWLNVEAEEIAFTRNTTESLNTIIFGIPLNKGDEVVLSPYDYPFVINAWKQRSKREGIVLKWTTFELPFQDEESVIESYRNLLSKKTKLIHLTHVLNWNGQILPIKKIIDLAHSNACEVLVDAAHSLGIVEFDISELKCDYLATSFHKWMNGPIGTGLLYVSKKHISKIWPLHASYDSLSGDIKKFETIGVNSFANYLALHQALDFHEKLTLQSKRLRLINLTNFLVSELKKIPKVKLISTSDLEQINGMVSLEIEGMQGSFICKKLLADFKIHTTEIQIENLNGIRISPAIFNSKSELLSLIDGIKKIVMN